MIRNWREHELYMDFSHLNYGRGQPSDIDMFYIGKDGFLLVGEIKHRRGSLKEPQRHFLETLVDNYKKPAMAIFVQHDCDVHSGWKKVDVSRCQVVEYYYNGHWRYPMSYTTVSEVVRKYTNYRPKLLTY